MNGSPALRTDRYELTMVDAALRAGTHERECVFEAFARRLPATRRYGIVAGTGRLLELIDQFRFGDDELDWLREAAVVDAATLDWLADYRFRGTIHGYQEGEVYFPGSPLLVVDAPFAEGVVLETLILSVLNYDSAVASAAARMVSAAGGRPLAEMGSRRANEHAAVTAARAAFIAGFSATSNLEAGRHWGVPTMGTAAHAFTLLHDSEEDAFRAQVDALGPGTTLLVDTFDVHAAIELAVKVAGPELGAVRLDSGDLPPLVKEVRTHLDSLGAVNTKITVTNDLDEYTIAALAASPVDSYGVGTAVVTGSGSPASGMVYKLVAHRNEAGAWIPVAKNSEGKRGVGGRKRPARRLDASGRAVAEVIHVEKPQGTDVGSADTGGDARGAAAGDAAPERELLVPLVVDGIVDQRYTGPRGTALAREHRAASVAELPPVAFRLGRGDPVLPTLYE
ncbi:nicotinate phosphoribosyltransferase [Microbacterium sp. STN6]|uniref:nicotinate phosphoribosyltransferase n=1 Tax=Microbacterium sp. STN6 TaxID=2995588 RepID=UPI002260FCC3|nr:nicotinate phosphoribosyltransferase [Microbacterium sp. STN6]MCX7521989.1 nicotinate phosphoribosyltransferase [Microbacterium sp. STN6]